MRAGPCAVTLCIVFAGCGDLGLGSGGEKHQGVFTGPLVWTVTSRVSCVTTYAVSGDIEIELKQSGDNVTGEGSVELTQTPGPVSPAECGPAPNRSWGGSGAITGTTSSFRFSHQYTASGVLVETSTATFIGELSDDVIEGTLAIDLSGSGTIEGVSTTTGGSATFNVTLRR